jgi:thioredoxin-related protein
MKKLLFSIFTILSIFSFGQISLEHYNHDYLKDKKITILYFYTDWCAYCKIQEREIENNNDIRNSLNHDFYFIKLNAESRDEIIFLDEKYSPVIINSKVKTHSFVRNFTEDNKNDSYPLWIFLDEDLKIIGKHSGFLNTKNLNKILKIKKIATKL